MTYGVLLPHIFIPGFLLVLAIYWRDKLLILTTYRVKYFFSEDLAKISLRLLHISPVISFGIFIWIFGNRNWFSRQEFFQEPIVTAKAGTSALLDSEDNRLTFLNEPFKVSVGFFAQNMHTYLAQVRQRYRDSDNFQFKEIFLAITLVYTSLKIAWIWRYKNRIVAQKKREK